MHPIKLKTIYTLILILSIVLSSTVPSRAAVIDTPRPSETGAALISRPTRHPLTRQADASINYIVINGSGFSPTTITIEVGASITWHNATGSSQPIHRGTPPSSRPPSQKLFLPLITNDNAGVSQFAAQQTASPAAPVEENPPIATIAAGADFSQTFEQPGTFNFYLGAEPFRSGQVIVQERNPTTLTSVSPANGEADVAVTRETIIQFSHPLDANTVTEGSVYAQFGGNKLAATRHLSPDRRRLTLFYDQPLPASARVRVTVDGDQLHDERGETVDANGDGIAGGTATIDFDTLGIAVVPGTSVCGTVYASELGDDGNGGTVDVPLQGTRITVDGMETALFAITDTNGNFCLDPAPAGRFFVHIDGRTATANVPAGAYYPFVGKAWEARAGAQTDIGNVYLPLVVPGTLQAVSQSEETMIHLAQSVLDERPEFADVAIMVPPDSLFADDGTRGGQVGIAPVPPDRLPGTLPKSLRFPLVITVQTDGATNFDTPAPVCFPNLPDPVTNVTLAPGAKSALMSFNHDAGRWEVIGPMTISDNGTLVCTDPGVGILAPGWHGVRPPNPYVKAPVTCNDDFTLLNAFKIGKSVLSCLDKAKELVRAIESIANLVDAGIDLKSKSDGLYTRLINRTLTAEDARAGIESLKAFKDLMEGLFSIATGFNPAELAVDATKCVGNVSTTLAGELCGSVFKCSENSAVKYFCTQIVPELKFLNTLTQKITDLVKNLKKAPLIVACLSLERLITNLEMAAGQNSNARNINFNGIIEPTPELIALWGTFDADLANFVNPLAGTLDEGMAVAKDLEHTLGEASSATSIILTTSGGFTNIPGKLRLGVEPPFTSEEDIFLTPNGYANVSPALRFQLDLYNRKFEATVRFEGTFPSSGGVPRDDHTLYLGSPRDLCDGYLVCPPAPGFVQPTYTFITDILFEEDEADGDHDALSDIAEGVVGTDPSNPDTDNDGISDGAEVQQGTNPLDGLPARTGIIASADTPGIAVDVCALNELAIVADSDAGISVFNVNNGQNPITIAQVDTPGEATRVTCANDVVAVADGSAGLAIVDITDPPAANITDQLALGDVKAVAAAAGIVYAGAADGSVTAVSLQDGTIINSVSIHKPVLDIQVGHDALYVYAKDDLYTISLLGGMAIIDNDTVPGTYAANEIRPLRLFVGDDIAYAVHRKGYDTFDLTDPANPVLIANGDTPQFGWRQIVDNGSGLGVATVGPNSTPDGPHHISLYDVSDPTQTNQFQTEFETPGLATAVSIYNGLAYVADGEAGLQVINYRAYDALGVPPTIAITTNAVGGNIEEGQTLHFRAQVSDDVQVRNVTFIMDGEPAVTDGNFPFAHRFITPLLSQQSSLVLTAKATDTGGNLSWATPITLTIVPDSTPPQVGVMDPADGTARYNTEFPVTIVSANFNEPINPATLTADSFQLYAAGADGTIGTDDDTQIISGTLSYQKPLNMALLTFAGPLPVGQYQAVINSTVTDMAGNALTTPFSWQFRVTDGTFGNWNLSRTIPFNSPQAAHYNPVNGLIYVGRRGTSSDGLYRIDADNSATQVASGTDVAAVAVDPESGHIFFSEDGPGIIYRVGITDTTRTKWVSGFHGNDDDPVGMAFASANYSGSAISAGDGLVVDRGYNGPVEVWRFSPDVAEGETAVHSDDGTLVDSVDIAIGLNDIYLVDDKDAGDGVIYRLNAGGALTVITTTASLPAPEGITIDPLTGNLLVMDVVNAKVYDINPVSGVAVDMLPGFVFDFPGGSSWAGIDISPDGQQLIITDKGANVIYLFTRAN